MAGLKSKYLWITDLHLNRVSPWKKLLFIYHLIRENPKGIIITGDISNGMFLYYDLYLLASFVKCPIYFILGNHCYWHSSFEETHEKLKKLIKIFPHLIWLTESDPIWLRKKTVLIGHEGWYDGINGNPKLLRFNMDRLFIKDLKERSFEEELIFYQDLAKQSANNICEKLLKVIAEGAKTIYIATHFPPYVEATRHHGKLFEQFWLAYDTNSALGAKIKEIMENHKDRKVIVLAAHTHESKILQIKSNIMCIVNRNKNYGWIRNDEVLFI